MALNEIGNVSTYHNHQPVNSLNNVGNTQKLVLWKLCKLLKYCTTKCVFSFAHFQSFVTNLTYNFHNCMGILRAADL